jgi:hypothetical protein
VKTTPACGRLELLSFIEDYRQGLLPLIVLWTLLKHHLSRHPVQDWEPVPGEASGTPAGVPPSVSQGAHAAESRLIQSFVSLAVGASTALEGASRVASPGIK